MKLKRMHAMGVGVLTALGGMVAYGALQRTDDAVQGASLVDEASERAEVRGGDDARESRALASRVESLSAEVEALRALVAQQRAEQERGAAPQAEPMPSEGEQHEIWEEHVSYAEASFNDEAVDSRWASSTGTLIQQQIAAAPALRDKTQALECRSRSCRVELRDDGSTAFASELPTLVHRLGPLLSSVVVDLVQDGSGRKTQVLYMTRAEATASLSAPRAM